jgi:sigma-B regulation protein RsbU (phosphoserine phosphatase)
MDSLNLSIHDKVGARMFTALCLMVLEPPTPSLTFANAGLCEPLLRSGDSTKYLSSPGDRFPLGAIRASTYQSRTLDLTAGDVVVVFSDGVPEARNRAGEQYGYAAPRDLVARLDVSALGADQIKEAIVDDVCRWCHGSRLSDDMTIVVIKTAGASDVGGPHSGSPRAERDRA